MPSAAPQLDLRIVLYEHKGDNQPRHFDTTWEALVEFLRDHEESPCTVATCVGAKCPHKSASSLPWQDGSPNPMAWSPVEIQGLRSNANVRAVTALAFEFDHLAPEAWERVKTRLRPWEHVWHTTHNHRGVLEGPQDPTIKADIGIRVVARLSRKVHANEYRRFRAAAVEYLGVTVADRLGTQQPDRSCKDLSRQYFRPSHPKGAHHAAEHVRGDVLDVDAVFDWARDRVVEPPSPFDAGRALPDESDWDLDSEALEAAVEVMATHFPPSRRHELCLALGGMLRRAGATQETAEYVVYTIADRGGSDDPETRAKTVGHTYSIPDEGEMTGYTRVIDVLAQFHGQERAEQIASDFGGHLTDAANESFLRNIAVLAPSRSPAEIDQAKAKNLHEERVRQDVAAALQRPPVVDAETLRKEISSLAMSKYRSFKRDEKVDGLLLRRVLNGQQLAMPGGVGDPETRYEGEHGGVTPDKAIGKVAGMVAFAVPLGTPWGALAEIFRVSLATIDGALDRAGKLYERAMGRRAELEVKRAQEDDARRERATAAITHSQPSAIGNAALAQAPPEPTRVSAPAEPKARVDSGPPDGEKWADLLAKSPNGSPSSAAHNITMVFRNDEILRGAFAWNEHDKQLEARGVFALYSDRGPEAIVTHVQDYLSSNWGFTIGFPDIKRRIMNMAYENAYDPLADWLRACGAKWDGKKRVDNWLVRYLGAEDTAHNRRISRRWIVGAVSRGLDPGSKFENVLVLEQAQGARKTSAWEALGGKFYDATQIDIRDKDSKMLAASTFIQEMGELDSVRRSETSSQKAFFSQRVDKFRAPFAAALQKSPRRMVPVSSTNEERYFTDVTGNRRWWPVRCGKIDLPALLEDAEQLWGEAVAIFLAHRDCADCRASNDTVYGQTARCEVHRWWLTPDEVKESCEIADERMEDQPWMVWREKITRWWRETPLAKRPAAVTATMIALEVGELSVRDVSRGVLTEIGYAMARAGFVRDSKARHYIPSAELLGVQYVRGLFVLPGGKDESNQTPV